MPARFSDAVNSARRAAVGPADAPPDGQLLAAFLADRDADSFAALVRRHGPMVLGICRRVTGHAQDAEDAFQAVFVVLARRAADIAPRSAVGGWLYGVAVRTAQEARSVAAKRRTREALVPAVPDVGRDDPEPLSDEVRVILDEELGRLPEKYRALLVACDIEGMAQAEVARQLRLPVGTIYSRLSAARKRLAVRLRKRGVSLPAAGLGVALSHGMSAAVPAALVARAVAAGVAGTASASVSALVHGVLRTMFLQKLKAVPHGVLAIAAICAGGWLVLPALQAREAPKPTAVAARNPHVQPAAKPAGPGQLLLARKGSFLVYTPDGKQVAELAEPKDTHSGGRAALSPDGKRAALVVLKDEPPSIERTEPWPFKIVIWELGKAEPAGVWDIPADGLSLGGWTPDGKSVIVAKETGRLPNPTFETVALDPATGKTETLARDRVLDVSQDGKKRLIEFYDDVRKVWRLGLTDLDKMQTLPLVDLRTHAGSATARFSPDGKQFLYINGDPERKDAHKWGMSQRPYLYDLTTRRAVPLPDFPENAQAHGIAWSPDGKKIAYTWKQLHPDLLKKDTWTPDETTIDTEAFLVVADADGKNARTVASEKGPFAINMVYGSIDWK